MANKKELAKLAISLFDNIDQADQFDPYEPFYHLDNAYLLYLIGDFYDTIKQNERLGQDFTTMPKEELNEIMTKARKILKIEDDED